MLSWKERNVIKKMVNLYCNKTWIAMVRGIYVDIKQYEANALKEKLDLNHEKKVKVKYKEAYQDLIKSVELYKKHTENMNRLSDIRRDGIKLEGGVSVDFTDSFIRTSCKQTILGIRIYEDLCLRYDRYTDTEKKILMSIYYCIMHETEKRMAADDIWSYNAWVEKLKDGERKYGTSFFVNEWLYDTFKSPELFSSYGVHKNENGSNMYSLNKKEITQDVI